jgi:hypothetical protein
MGQQIDSPDFDRWADMLQSRSKKLIAAVLAIQVLSSGAALLGTGQPNSMLLVAIVGIVAMNLGLSTVDSRRYWQWPVTLQMIALGVVLLESFSRGGA